MTVSLERALRTAPRRVVRVAVVVMLLNLADGNAGERTGQYLVSYDARHAEPLGAGLVTTHRRQEATEFPGPVQAWEVVAAPSGRTRADGLPDKPLMVYTLIMDTVGGDPGATAALAAAAGVVVAGPQAAA